jgi:hypothetical protein
VIGLADLDLRVWPLQAHTCPPVTISAFVILYFLKGSNNVSRHDAD